ncbi:hypothetical protein KJ359_005554 [Pestalotiopsis sp. 9143b]|nr:hypothetical protein KJ359_005554 [Pestalotiopsis sp. 9143b]
MIESAKKTRLGARGARKVKTGCQTCKTRRKKCDEARPTCSQCRLAGWRCDFEADDSSISSAVAVSRAEAQAQPSAALAVVRPPGVIASPPSGIQVERQLLEYFKRVTWMDFAYFFDDLSWERQLLPAITTEPIIYHTGLAISALGWSLAHPSNLWTRGGDPVRSADEYCTMQYNKAVHLFKSRMENPLEDAHALQVLILGSLMFIHLEFMRGLTDFVQVHLRGANALLKSLKQRSRDTAFLEAAVAYNKILSMTEAREYPKTICPSEVARALNQDELHSLNCSDWREAMDPIRKEAWFMKERRLLDITQKGEVVSGDDLDQIRGPIRLRRILRD